MQRWILIGVAAAILILVGGAAAYWQIKQNRPHPMWIPIPLNAEMPLEQRDAMVKKLKVSLRERTRMVQISKELGLTQKLPFATDEAVADALATRLFVKVGEFNTGTATIPTLNIGVDGTHKEAKISEEIAKRVLEDVWKILGVKPPTHSSDRPQ